MLAVAWSDVLDAVTPVELLGKKSCTSTRIGMEGRQSANHS